ncbi:replication initiation factor domain-containing protein [Acinetobacter puyangensis]|uniref:replication initiation factor domain-containing protein n=1 Tax=Acinetobacter puyangensis TaxID=1096779 RepID=UPI003A4DEC24
MVTNFPDLPFDNNPVKTKKQFNKALSKKSKQYQSFKPFPTFGLWGSLWDMISPFSNTGEKSATQQAYEITYGQFYKDYPVLETITVMTNKGPKPVLIRRPAKNECAIIDFLHITIHKNTFKDVIKTKQIKEYDLSSNSDYVYAFEIVLKDILGIGIDKKLQNGKNFYQESYALENDSGLVCIGGQNDTILLVLNGQGCTAAKYGWEEDLHAWLTMYAERPKITRIDYAYDDLEGDLISPDWAWNQDDLGGFQCGGRPPSFTTAGQWKRPDGSGRTAYIGKRESGKYCRIYEKGKQLGDPDSLWTRCEVEYKAKDYFIPLDALVNASEHFLAAYPCFHVFDNVKIPEKFVCLNTKADITIEKAKEITKHQFSKYLKFFRDYYGDDSAVLDMLMPDPDCREQYPKRIKPILIDYSQSMAA